MTLQYFANDLRGSAVFYDDFIPDLLLLLLSVPLFYCDVVLELDWAIFDGSPPIKC